MKFEAVIFDLDGTLLDTLDDIADAANRVLAKRNHPQHPVDAYRSFVGDGVAMLMWRILPASDRDSATVRTCVDAFRRAYAANWKAKTQPYDGIADMLDALVAMGMRLGVLSNKPDDFTRRCVEELLGRWTFDAVAGERPGIARKPDPAGALALVSDMGSEPEHVVYVGDSGMDMAAACAAGLYPVGVLWGFRGREELERSGAARIVDAPSQVVDVVRAEG